MHDGSEQDEVRERNKSLEMAEILIPKLWDRGYQFVKLDEVPQVVSATLVSRRIALRAPNGQFLSAQQLGGGEVMADDFSDPDWAKWTDWREFGLVELEGDQMALRAPNGQFLSAQQLGNGAVLANGPKIDVSEVFTMFQLNDNHVAFGAPDGIHLLSTQELGGGEVLATGTAINATEKFTIVDLQSVV
jgi:hypothetical protein